MSEVPLYQGEEEWRAPAEWLGPPGPVHVLRKREEDSGWWQSFERLQVVLREAATKVNPKPETRIPNSEI